MSEEVLATSPEHGEAVNQQPQEPLQHTEEEPVQQEEQQEQEQQQEPQQEQEQEQAEEPAPKEDKAEDEMSQPEEEQHPEVEAAQPDAAGAEGDRDPAEQQDQPDAPSPGAIGDSAASAAAEKEENENENGPDEEDAFYAPPPDHVTGEVGDLARLTNLNEETLLQEIKVRYGRDIIYTFISDILIAVNPFKQLPIYGTNMMVKYNNQGRHTVDPHIYVIADSCYHNLFTTKKNQCAVISGESGAGKTESAKLVINYIIELSRNVDPTTSDLNLEEQILKINPLLEAFGNAQTVMNDNSSRFGKYTRLYFDAAGRAMGVEISEYLLEKSRVVEQAFGERNFHVFYYLFEGEDKAKYHLTDSTDFHALGGKPWLDNAEMFKELREAMDVVGFSQEDLDNLFSILAAIVHLGNVQFEAAGEHADVKDRTALEHAADMLKVSADDLAGVLLGFTTVTRGEEIRRLYDVDHAYDCRDALAKALYGSLFGWIVQRVNEMLSPELQQLKLAKGRPGAASRVAPSYEIGVLDIFGFENFENNSFEQICINLAHEQLQYFFNQHTFRLELQEYEAEGIDGASISFRDNKPLLDMFLQKPIGILTLLDEECAFPQATDQSFVDKLNKHFNDNKAFVPVKVSRGHPAFGIRHFAADVEYNATNMIEKNRDNLAADIVNLMKESGRAVVNDVFNGEILSTGQIRAVKRDVERRVHRGKEVESPAKRGSNTANRRAPSLSSQFKSSLSTLVERMNACFPHFVRCIKPNFDQRSDLFIDEFVLKQLGYTGVLEATRIRQEGYSWRPAFAQFVERYKILAFPVTKLNQVKHTEATAVKIIQHVGLQNWKVGRTKLFLKFYHLDQLENAMEKFYEDVVRTQCAVRSYFARKVYKKKLERARMSAAQRAEAERREAEERAKQESKRQAELEKMLEQQRLEHEKAELEARRAEDLRLTQELEAKKAQAEVERARQEADRLKQHEEAQEARRLAELKAKEAEEALRERERALADAQEMKAQIETKQQELQLLTQAAEEAKRQVQHAEKEAKKQAFMRTKSRKKRQADAAMREKLAREKFEAEARAADEARLASDKAAEEARQLAKKQEEDFRLSVMQKEQEYKQMMERIQLERAEAERKAEEQARLAEEMRLAREKAEEEARRAEQERQAEDARLAAERALEEKERKDGDFRRDDFSFKRRLTHLMGRAPTSPDIKVSEKIVQGWLYKLGNMRKSWRHRWFVVDLNDMTLRYFASESAKKEKNCFNVDELQRVYKPRASSLSTHRFARHHHILALETPLRIYYLECPSPEALDTWHSVLSIVTNPDLKSSDA